MYHTKPCVISAFQYDGDVMDRNGEYYVPKWAVEAFRQRVLKYDFDELYLYTDFCQYGQVVEPGFFVTLLPNNSIIAMDPVSFNWLFESTAEE